MRFIPGTAQDVRTYFLALQYWLAGSEREPGQPGAHAGRPLRRGDASRLRAAGGAGRTTRMSACITRASPGQHRGAAAEPAGARARRARSGCCCCAPTSISRQRRALRRRDRGARGARAARDPGLRQRARLAAGDRGVFHARRRRHGGRRGVADRVLAGGRARLQRQPRGRGRCWRSWTCPTSRRTRSSSRPRAVGARPARPAAGGGDDDGRDPGAGRRHQPDDVRRALRRAPSAGRLRRQHARTWSPPGARGDAGRRGSPAGGAAPRGAGRARVAMVLFNFPPNAGATGTAAYLAVFASPVQHAARDAGRRLHASTCRTRSMRCARLLVGNAASATARMPTWPRGSRRRPCAPPALAGRDRGAAGVPAPGRRSPTGRASSCWGALRQRVRRPAAGLRLRGRPDAPAVRAAASRRPTRSRLLPLDPRGFRGRTRCCISAPTARWSSCRASRPGCRPRAGRTG